MDTDRDLNILFAASGDIHNVIETIVSLPNNYGATVTVTVNDFNFDVVAFNLVLLMAAFVFEPEEAAAIMLHM